MIRTGYLRVYVPARGDDDWAPHPGPAAARRRVFSLGEYGMWQESLRNDAFTARWEDRAWVCPRYPRLRMLEGFMAFRNAYPGTVASLLAPERVVRRAADELQSIYRDDPSARSHILTASWHIPLRWFAAFTPDEREVTERADGHTTIRYRTAMATARNRLDRAVEVLDEAGFDEAIIAPVKDLREWLDEFGPDAMVELDYGSIADWFTAGELVMDETAAEVAASLDALAAGELETAGSHYAAAATRWAHAQSMLYAN